MTGPDIANVISSVLAPARFVVFRPLQLTWDASERETLHWEIYNGQLLGASMTREIQSFRAWNVRGIVEGKPNDEPYVSIKQNIHDGTLYVTRGLLCHSHRVVTTGNVIETRDDLIWSRELVGTITAEQFARAAELEPELSHLVFAAIVGTSQLPLTSLESPLPEFSLGRLGYLPAALQPRYTVKHLELMLRSPTPIEAIAARWPPADALAMLREVFLGISLSPYTNFVTRTLALLREWQASTAITLDQRIDFLSWLIRLQWRHLNAYDLFMFHHRGANYPDALLVEEVLHELLAGVESNPSIFNGPSAQLRRRAVRCGWFLREIYAGLRVPPHPTSPGENTRVLPAPWKHLSEAEILNPYQRSKELFREPIVLTPATERLIRLSIQDLDDDRELRDLGTALFLDRPLGWSKSLGEPDLTPVLTYIAFSRKLALRHIENLERHDTCFLTPEVTTELQQRTATLEVSGATIPHLNRPTRPGVLSLSDALQNADDFVIERTTRRTMSAFSQYFDLSTVAGTAGDSTCWRLILPRKAAQSEVLEVFSNDFAPLLYLEPDTSGGYQTRSGVELPVRGLSARWLPDGPPIAVRLR